MTLQKYYSEVIEAAFKQTPFVRQEIQILAEIFSDAAEVVGEEAIFTHLKCSDSWSQDLPTPYRSQTRGSDLVTGLRNESNLMALVHRACLVLTLQKSLSTFLDPISSKRKPTKLSRTLGLMILFLYCNTVLGNKFQTSIVLKNNSKIKLQQWH